MLLASLKTLYSSMKAGSLNQRSNLRYAYQELLKCKMFQVKPLTSNVVS